MMYEQFFGFRERPFDLTPNPEVPGADRLASRGGQQPGVRDREPQGTSRSSSARPGPGKTTVIRTAVERQPSARALRPPAQPDAVARRVRRDARDAIRPVGGSARSRRRRMLLELEALLEKRHEIGETTVLIVDEAQSLPLELLEEIRLLANIETDDEKLLSVIIAGQPELADRLNDRVAAAAEAARRAAVRAPAADAAGDGRLHRRTHPRRRRRRRAGVHARGGRR